MQISIFGSLNGNGSAVDDTIAYLSELRDEGFRRAWFSHRHQHRDADIDSGHFSAENKPADQVRREVARS